MADRFPDPVEKTLRNYFFDHLIAYVNEGLAPGELWYAHGIAIDSDTNQIFVAEGIYFHEISPENIARVSIFSETGEFINTFSHPRMEYPWGIAIHRDNVYVTDSRAHSVFHFKIGADFPLFNRLGSFGSDIGQFNDPRQLAVSTHGDIFVTDRINNRVQILDSELHYQRHITHLSMKLPIDVKLTPDEVFVLCQCSPCVKVLSYTGDLIRSLVTRGDIGMQLRESWFFCLDANSNLLLSDWLGHQIKLFSKEGTLLDTFGKRDHGVGMFYLPQGIALSNNVKLIVVSRNRNYSLQIYYIFE